MQIHPGRFVILQNKYIGKWSERHEIKKFEGDGEMKTENPSHVDEMITRFKEFYGLRFDTEMARKLGLSDGSAIGNWRRRDSIDLLLIAKLCPEINLDWLIWGRGTPMPSLSDGVGVNYDLPAGVLKQDILHLVNEALERYLRKPLKAPEDLQKKG